MAALGRWGRMIAVLCASTLLLSLAACAKVVDGTGSRDVAPNAQLKVVGDTGSPFDTEAKNALSDVMAFWQKEYPKVSGGKSLPPLKGGLYSVNGAQVVATGHVQGPAAEEGCAKRKPDFIIDNAAYCLIDDSIIWDRDPQHLVGVLFRNYGPLLMGLVFAHEFGHAIQSRLNVDPSGNLPTIYTESQADCAAGAWVASAFAGDAPHFKITPADLDNALNGYLQVRDSTPQSPADISHGNGFDRISAIDDGIEHGVTYCYNQNYFHRTFTERGYVPDTQQGQIDAARGGNEPFQQVINAGDPAKDPNAGGLQPDLNAFWKQAAAQPGVNKTWKDVAIAQADHPKCDPNGTSLFEYCPSDNTVYFNRTYAEQAYYSLTAISIDPHTANVTLVKNQAADFALGALFAVAWGMAVRHQLFGRPVTGSDALLAAVCYTGAYAENINTDNPPRNFSLSPPDMDEATSAVLNLVGTDKAFGARGTTGLKRIQAFVKGYTGGLGVC